MLEPIQNEHLRHKTFIDKNHIEIGTKLLMKDNTIRVIKHIHPMYYWLGDDQSQISIDEVKGVIRLWIQTS